jgi:hypothetical protein
MLSLLLPLTLAATPAASATIYSPADIADARCMAVFAVMADGSEPTAKQAGVMGMIYFVGKLVGRNPTVDLEAILRSVAPDAAKDAATYLPTCGAELQTVGHKMTVAGEALSGNSSSPIPHKP